MTTPSVAVEALTMVMVVSCQNVSRKRTAATLKHSTVQLHRFNGPQFLKGGR
jgi:hypothetical protein